MENSDKPRVKIAHFRTGLYPLTPWRMARYQRGRGFLTAGGRVIQKQPTERGGLTTARVELGKLFVQEISIKHIVAGGNTATTIGAFAACSAKDSFCYKLGRDIAVGRLRKQLTLWGLEDAVAWP